MWSNFRLILHDDDLPVRIDVAVGPLVAPSEERKLKLDAGVSAVEALEGTEARAAPQSREHVRIALTDGKVETIAPSQIIPVRRPVDLITRFAALAVPRE